MYIQLGRLELTTETSIETKEDLELLLKMTGILKKLALPYSPVTLKEYESWIDAENVDTYHDKITYDIIALGGEVGEVQNVWKSKARGRTTDKDFAEDMLLELGDVLHYFIRVAHDLGYTVEDIAAANKFKLLQRKLHGKGGAGKFS